MKIGNPPVSPISRNDMGKKTEGEKAKKVGQPSRIKQNGWSQVAKAITYAAGATAAISGLATPAAAAQCPPGYYRQNHSPNDFHWLYTTDWPDRGQSGCFNKLSHPENIKLATDIITGKRQGDVNHHLGGLNCHALIDYVRPIRCRGDGHFPFWRHEISDFLAELSVCCPDPRNFP